MGLERRSCSGPFVQWRTELKHVWTNNELELRKKYLPRTRFYFDSMEHAMNNIIYTVGLIVIVLAILSFAGVI
jgi:hypothetical protein